MEEKDGLKKKTAFPPEKLIAIDFARNMLLDMTLPDRIQTGMKSI